MRVQDLLAYKKAFDLSMEIYQLSKSFTKEETYSLIDQIRRSSRSFVQIYLNPIEKDVILKILLVN